MAGRQRIMLLGARRTQPVVRLLHRVALRGMNYGPSDPLTDGEMYVLHRMAAQWGHRPMVFDVGANQGDWTKLVQQVTPEAEIHAFEPSPASYELLDAPHKHQLALSDTDGETILYGDSPTSGLNSLHQRRTVDSHAIATVQTRRLDTFCAEKNISSIHMLKLDVEGHELAVLRGAGTMLNPSAIQVIQFEFGGTAVDARVYLRDFVDLLAPAYRIFRVLRDGLHPLDYHERDEVFVAANYVCVPAYWDAAF